MIKGTSIISSDPSCKMSMHDSFIVYFRQKMHVSLQNKFAQRWSFCENQKDCFKDFKIWALKKM